MILSTQTQLGEYQITETLGIVSGNTVRSRNMFGNAWAGLRSLGGGEIKSWTQVCSHTRDEAIQRMIEHAETLGADAIVGTHFVTTEVAQTASEMLAYGTAVKIKKK